MYVQLFIFSKILYNIRIPGFSESLVRHPGKFNFLDMCISLIREFRSADLFRRFIRSIRRQYMSFVLAYNHSVIFHITTIYLSTRICSIISQCIVQHNTESNFFILNHIIRNRYIKTQHMFGSCFTYSGYFLGSYHFILLKYIVTIPIKPCTNSIWVTFSRLPVLYCHFQLISFSFFHTSHIICPKIFILLSVKLRIPFYLGKFYFRDMCIRSKTWIKQAIRSVRIVKQNPKTNLLNGNRSSFKFQN